MHAWHLNIHLCLSKYNLSQEYYMQQSQINLSYRYLAIYEWLGDTLI